MLAPGPGLRLCCRCMVDRMLIALPSPLLYAHRGTPLDLPENTMPGFRRALGLGAGALETDVHLTRDGHVVISHDLDGLRLAGVAQSIRDTTLAEVETWDPGARFTSRTGERFAGRGFRVPTFEELLRETPGVPINVDIKQREPSMVAPLLELLERTHSSDRVLLASFSAATLREVRRRGYPGRTSLGVSEALRLMALPVAVLKRLPLPGTVAQLGTRAMGIDFTRPWIIDKCHALGLRIEYWTVNDPREASRLWKMGADAVMTDDPEALIPALGALSEAAGTNPGPHRG